MKDFKFLPRQCSEAELCIVQFSPYTCPPLSAFSIWYSTLSRERLSLILTATAFLFSFCLFGFCKLYIRVLWTMEDVAIFVSPKHLVTNVLVSMVHFWSKMGRIAHTVSRQYFNNFFIFLFFFYFLHFSWDLITYLTNLGHEIQHHNLQLICHIIWNSRLSGRVEDLHLEPPDLWCNLCSLANESCFFKLDSIGRAS